MGSNKFAILRAKYVHNTFVPDANEFHSHLNLTRYLIQMQLHGTYVYCLSKITVYSTLHRKAYLGQWYSLVSFE